MARRVDCSSLQRMPEPIVVQYHNCGFAHLKMQKQSGNGVKGSRSGEGEKDRQPTKKKHVKRK